MIDIVPPCDCAYELDGNWVSRCYCSNRDDGERVAAWCASVNSVGAIATLTAEAAYDAETIRHLKQECREAAAEIKRLRVENIQMRFALGYPMPADLERYILPSNPFKCGTCGARAALAQGGE